MSFVADLGVQWDEGAAVLPGAESLNYRGMLHGGATAAFVLLACGGGAGPLALHVAYPRAARRPPFRATTATVRTRQELALHETRVEDDSGTVVAHAITTVTGPAPGGDSADDDGSAAVAPPRPLLPDGDPTEYDEATQQVPFLAGRQIRVVGVGRGELAMTMGPAGRNLDADGTLHPGALLTLIDAAGTSVPWTLDRPSASGATVALQAHLLGPLSADPVQARAHVRARRGRLMWCDVALTGAADGRLRALATVTYRFADPPT